MRKSTPRRKLTQFGIAVKVELLKNGQTQEWLIKQCREKTDMFADSKVMLDLFSGQRKIPKIEAAIREILGMDENQQAG